VNGTFVSELKHLNFEFDCLEKMIFDLNKIILVMMLFYRIFLCHEHICDSCKNRVKPVVSVLNYSVKFSVQMCLRKISSVPEIIFRKNPHNNMLIKLIPGVNFINILSETFLYKSALHTFSLIIVWVYNFWSKNIGEKAVRKILIKLTPG